MIDRIDSVFLFGTGIVSGPWEPVLRALAKKYGTNLGRDAKGQDVATRWLGLHGINTPSKPPDQQLANWVFGVRVNSARIVASLGAPRNFSAVRHAYPFALFRIVGGFGQATDHARVT